MWRHQAGRIDFDGPLSRLWRRGWAFREYAADRRRPRRWSLVRRRGPRRGPVRGDRPERRDAWAEAVRLALVAAVDARSPTMAPLSATLGARRHPSRSFSNSRSHVPHRLIGEIDMSTREESEAGRHETRRAYDDHKHRFHRLRRRRPGVRRPAPGGGGGAPGGTDPRRLGRETAGGRAARHRTRDPPTLGERAARGRRGPVDGAVARFRRGCGRTDRDGHRSQPGPRDTA